MHRVTAIKPAGEWNAASARDRVLLDAVDRLRRRIVLTGERGTAFLLDLAKPAALRDGDGVVLDDGSIVLVCGKREPLVEIVAQSAVDAVRLAWHLGNRHTDVQIVGGKIRIRHDPVLEDMLRGLGATVTPLMRVRSGSAAAPHESEHGHGRNERMAEEKDGAASSPRSDGQGRSVRGVSALCPTRCPHRNTALARDA
jgi:urease accessory protein